jgi:sugar lactone lactonase YvrE
MSCSIGSAALRRAVVSLICLLLSPAFLLATAPPVTFPGVVNVLSTGSISLSAPAGVTVDPSRNVYIADTSNNQIVKVDVSGNASVLAITGLGTALSSPSAVAVDGSDNLYIADKGNSRIVLVSSSGAGSVVNTGAVTLSLPQGVALDPSGNLFIADSGHNQIAKVSSGVTSVFTITGLGTALSTPKGLAEDASGNLYIADSANNRIVKVTSGGAGSVLNLSGLGTALSAPSGVAVDTFGNLYIADPGNNRIVSATSLSALATGSLTLSAPKGVAVDVFGNLFVAESGSNNRVDSIQVNYANYGHTQLGSSTGKVLYVPYAVTGGTTLTNFTIWTMGAGLNDFAGTSNPGTPCVAQLYSTDSICTIAVQYLPVGPGLRQGGMILTSTAGGQTYTTTVPLYGFADASLAALSPGTASVMNSGGVSLGNPFQIAVDGSGIMYVGNYTSSNVVKIPASGGTATLVSAGSYTFGQVTGVAVNGAGDLFIADYEHSRIIEITAGGVSSELTVTAAGSSIALPAALAVDVAGNLFIADFGNSRVVKVKPPDVTSATASLTGTVVNITGYTFSASSITAIAVDTAGNLYLTDRSANKVVKVTPAGVAAQLAISGLTLRNPQGIAVDGMETYILQTRATIASCS